MATRAMSQTVMKRISGALVSQPAIYELVQVLAGSRECYARFKTVLGSTAGKRVLDVGGGTGRTLAILEHDTDYLCADIDALKLGRMRRKSRSAWPVVADAGRLPVATASFDAVLAAFVCHHLDPGLLERALAEMARASRGRVLIMDPLRVAGRFISDTLWRYDEGSFPRTRAELTAAITRHLKIQAVSEFSIFHKYVLFECTPI